MSQPAADNFNKAFELETEIRKMKLELLKQELDDKLFSFREYIEKKQKKMMFLNQTEMNTTNSVANNTTDENEKNFSSILFLPVIGDLEMWHFIFIIFLIWFFLSIKIILILMAVLLKKESQSISNQIRFNVKIF